MISQTHFAVSDDETRYFMNGVYIDKVDGGIIMVASDGRRLSFISRKLEMDIPDAPIPRANSGRYRDKGSYLQTIVKDSPIYVFALRFKYWLSQRPFNRKIRQFFLDRFAEKA